MAQMSPTPDLSPMRRLVLAALVVALGLGLLFALQLDVRARLGDTDDATRLVMVRDLIAGHGWYDQRIARLQPPQGLVMHWSRLLDGGIAALDLALRPFVGATRAEWLARVIWPLAWIFPIAVAALVVARNLGERSAVAVTAVLLLVDLGAYRQFVPGRIDHHNVQIAMAMIALAAATSPSRRVRWAPVGGAAAGLGLAVGLEALPLQALIGAAWAIVFVAEPRQWRATAMYGLALAAVSAGVFVLQTPPDRWGVAVCDALGVNLAAGLAAGGLGLAAAAALGRDRGLGGRLVLVALAGAAAAGLTLALDPACVGGPFAGVDPQVRRLWLDGVEEVQPLWNIARLDRASAIEGAVVLLLASAAALALVWDERRRTPQAMLAAACLALAVPMAVTVWRMLDYPWWIGLPVLGAAISRVGARRLADRLLPTLALTVLVSPSVVASLAVRADRLIAPPHAPSPLALQAQATRGCFAPASFRRLAGLPPGVVFAVADLGPYILATTPQSVVVAPYHRMWRRMIQAHQALEATPQAARARVRALQASYVVDCAGVPIDQPNGSFGDRLRDGPAPGWLRRLSPPTEPIRIWKVL